MKIGILTFQASHNCGSMLQAYALRETLAKKYNADVELINYSNFVSRCMYGYIDWRPKKSAICSTLKKIRYFNTIYESRKWYNQFSNDFLVKSSIFCKNTSDLKKISSQYDMLIAGGDQIWNVRCADAGKEFFLNFADRSIRKIAYSPSLGGSNILKYADNLDEYRDYLSSFEKLSVREPNGKKWLEKLTGKEIPIIADPTLLLTQDEWTKWLPVPDIKEHFIFNYAFYHNREETNWVLQNISDKLGLPIYDIDYKAHAFYRLSKYGIKKFHMSGPLAFLSLMKKATLVMTQSFHGTLFSVLFNKNFWSYDCIGQHNLEDDRAIAILEQFGLPERYQIIDELEKKDLLKPIDYTEVNKKIKMLREEAFNYINSFM